MLNELLQKFLDPKQDLQLMLDVMTLHCYFKARQGSIASERINQGLEAR